MSIAVEDVIAYHQATKHHVHAHKTKDRQSVELAPSQIKPGTTLRVYFLTQEKKIDGKKVKQNLIFMIDGVPNHKKQWRVFKAF